MSRFPSDDHDHVLACFGRDVSNDTLFFAFGSQIEHSIGLGFHDSIARRFTAFLLALEDWQGRNVLVAYIVSL